MDALPTRTIGCTDCQQPLTEPQQDFVLEEYRALRKEIELRITAAERVETITVVAIALTYGWVFAKGDTLLGQPAWFIPFGLASLGAVRCFGLVQWMWGIGQYVKVIERTIYESQPLGWEWFVRPTARKRSRNALSLSALLLWCTLLVGTLVFAFWHPSIQDTSTSAQPVSTQPAAQTPSSPVQPSPQTQSGLRELTP